VSDEVAAELGRFGVPDARILVSPTAVDPERFAPRPDVGRGVRDTFGLGDAFVVGWLGSFRGFHGLDIVIDAFARLHEHARLARLLLGGSGTELDDVRALVRRHGLDDSVHFAGTIAHTSVPGFLGAMDAAVVSAPRQQPFHYSPIKLREYLASGLPVVAPRVGEIRTFLTEDENALLYDAGDAAGLAHCLMRLSDDRTLARRIGEQGRTLALATSTWDTRLDQLLAFPGYTAALGRARHAM
jgi:glycosyltransferase involved in cell wall biosynthesis